MCFGRLRKLEERKAKKEEKRLRRQQEKEKKQKGTKTKKQTPPVVYETSFVNVHARNRRAATARSERLWDYAVIPYEIESNFSGEQIAQIAQSLPDDYPVILNPYSAEIILYKSW